MIKLPVKVVPQRGMIAGYTSVVDSDGALVCINLTDAEANQIAVGLNAHDALVAALEKCLHEYYDNALEWGLEPTEYEWFNSCVKALKLAKGE